MVWSHDVACRQLFEAAFNNFNILQPPDPVDAVMICYSFVTATAGL